MKKILVVDGNSIINRAYYGMRPLTTKSGKTTHAVYGLINIISRQLSLLSPDYTVVAFDLKAPTFRHKMYSEYKAGRSPTPEDLLSQFPDAKECISLMGMTVMELPGFEADDIQGTVASFAKDDEELCSYILTGDRDLLQLIDERISVLLCTNNDTKLMNEETFRAEYEICPRCFVDMKALMGDSSDNIPGVAGIGKKTAQTLIKNFESLEGIYENIDDTRITKGVREKLIAGRDSAYLSRALARIKTDTPIEKTLDELAYRGFDRAGLFKKFSELELNSLIVKFNLKNAPHEDEKAEVSPTEGATDTSSITEKISYKSISADELSKTEEKRISVAILEGIVYISTPNGDFKYEDELSKVASFFSEKEIVCHDGKALYHALSRGGANLSGTTFLDLGVYAYVLNPGTGSSTPDALLAMFTGRSIDTSSPIVKFYSEIEAAMLEKVRADGLYNLLFDIEIPLVSVLAKMEERGLKINPERMTEFATALDELAEELTARIYMQAGREFNINSPKQLGEVLFEEMGLKCAKKKTKTGYSTDADTLEEMRHDNPIIEDILEYRQVTKLKGTYAGALPRLADENDRIHTDFKQTLTATGRLSSADPNLQNIPIRTKMGREMRRYFIAEEGYTLVDADYSQIELRLLAHISDDYNMREAFLSGDDIHTKTAAAVFGVPEESVNAEMRKRAKAVNFGIVYGIGGFSLAKDIGSSVKEASDYIKRYMMNYPSIDRYLTEVVEEAKEKGYTTTIFGRRRYIPELNMQNGNMKAFGKRIAMNAPIQGTAADIIKIAMIRVENRLMRDCPEARLVMQVHDELIVECPDRHTELVKRILKEEMEGAVSLSIPLTVEVTAGKNWLEQE